MTYKHFKSCSSMEEVKTTYKKLAMKLHPDRGGSNEAFIEMKKEYDYIIESNIVPTANYNSFGGFGNLNDIFAQFGGFEQQIREAERRKREYQEQMRRENIRRQQQNASHFAQAEEVRIKAFFERLAREDKTYEVIDGVIEEATEKDQNANWMLFELYKLDDLDVNHFKYVQWKLKLRKGWAMDTYSNYIKSREIKWK